MKTLVQSLLAAIALTACGESDAPNTNAPRTAAPAKPVVELTPVQQGAKIAATCRVCHTVEENGLHKVGPNLWGVYGTQAGSRDGFAYSKAMKASGIIWDETTMDAYLKKPGSSVPGGRMIFIGLKKQEDRDAVQTYLKEKTTP